MTTQMARADGSGAMFDQIAKRYDLLNRLMSFGMDRGWRKQLIESMPSDGELLDVATGTADVGLALARVHPQTTVVGLDPSQGMLDVGHTKIKSRKLGDRVTLVLGDAQAMDFETDRFSGCTIAFGIRNVPDRVKGLQEMARVVKPGGVVSILELSEPKGGLMSFMARLHVHHIVPMMGWILSGKKEYRYLQKSIAAFPPADDFAKMMTNAGLTDIKVIRLTFGVAHLYIGRVAG
ncbi:MAG: bifunctional demethylmenaquinone methyltransferase/2-methoxy-6-polyprenyl-1,4-benzoquinol methylase UbiE [Myxococcales bacterium]|nr:bifunctional demethylmenaquinone methyltransferase/2-methoxy-6-polyprenyl-1,4-benzoquinol methylase UbiE [Myxococcales bacterium]